MEEKGTDSLGRKGRRKMITMVLLLKMQLTRKCAW